MSLLRLRQNRPLTAYLFLVALSVLLMLLSSSKPLATARMFQTTILSPWLKTVRLAYRMGLVFRTDKMLWAELAQLRYERDRLLEMGQENKRLREIAQFKERTEDELIDAEVLGFGPRLESRSLIIDKGERHGIRRNMPVLSLQGLVGRVDKVFPEHSMVMVVTDHNCPVSARTFVGRHQGILEWDVFSGTLKMKGIPRQASVTRGEKVFTSGLGGVFPEGIEVGEVERVAENLDGITLDITVQPSVSFSSLEEVFVLAYEGFTPEFVNVTELDKE